MRFPIATAGGRETALTRCVYRTNSHSPGPRALRLTAGLHPALLVRVRLCIAKVAIPPAGDRARTRAGGVSPPVVTRPRLQRRTPTRRATVFRRVAVAPLQVRFATHGGLTPAAPGARGSLTAEKATFAMHESIFAGTRAGGVSPPWRYGNAHALQDALSDGGTRTREQETGRKPPPWLRYRDCNGVRQHAGDGLPKSGGSAFASALRDTRRAHARRSWRV